MMFVKKMALYALALSVLVWESLIYKPSRYLFDRLSKLIVLREVETFIRQLSPVPALCSFIVVVIALLPFKLLAVMQLKSGHPLLGMLSYVGAKVVGGFLITRLFDLTEPAIRKIGWVNFVLTKFFAYKNFLLAYYKTSAVYKHAHSLVVSFKQKAVALRVSVKKLFGA